MAEIIDFKAKKKEREITVELEDEGQHLIDTAIVALWTVIDGKRLKELVDDDQYLYWFLQFSAVCFDAMHDEMLVVDEDGNLLIEAGVRETMEDAIKEIEGELATKH